MVKPAGISVGTSFMLCTARSIVARQQRLFDLLGEQALAADLRQRHILILSPVVLMISMRVSAPAPPELAANVPRLPQRQRGTARANDDHPFPSRIVAASCSPDAPASPPACAISVISRVQQSCW